MRRLCAAFAIVGVSLLAASCGGGGGDNSSPSSPAQAYRVSGNVTGLHGVKLTLMLNGASPLTISQDGPFAFPAPVTGGVAYTVSATANSAWTACTITNGTGSPAADVTSVVVACGAAHFSTTVVTSSNGSTWGVASDHIGNVYYSLSSVLGISSVGRFSPDGNSTFIFGESEWQFRPVGIATDQNLNVYVADTAYTDIRMFTPGGVESHVGSGLNKPYGVGVDKAGNVFVADTGNNAIKKIASDGTITTEGSGFNAPQDVKSDDAGNLYVADTGNNAVKKITPNGTITSLGSGFSAPYSVAVDKSGSVFVADYGNNALKIIAPDGSMLLTATNYTIEGNPPSPHTFELPSGVWLEDSGSLLITTGILSLYGEVLRLTPQN
jgi:hypothetical protein